MEPKDIDMALWQLDEAVETAFEYMVRIYKWGRKVNEPPEYIS